MTPYSQVDLYVFWVYRAGLVYWPVLCRPGRQRMTRAAFDDPTRALLYGQAVEARYRRWVQATALKVLSVVFLWLALALATLAVWLVAIVG
ncbi:MAG TPA: hypothetical protein DCG54_09655 [Anaerolineae bacterium]|jgi:hypothetical protein|nr:hypothetical protein [Anaerolineae bacterium]